MASGRDLAQAWADAQIGTGETLATLGSSALAQPLSGIWGLSSYLRHLKGGADRDEAMRRARMDIEAAQEKLTYKPRNSVGQRAVENVGKVVEPVSQFLRDKIADPIGDRVPALGAGILAATEVVGGRGKPKAPKPTSFAADAAGLADIASPRPSALNAADVQDIGSALSASLRDEPYTNPRTGQMSLTGIEPLTPELEMQMGRTRLSDLRKDTEWGSAGYNADRVRDATAAFFAGARTNPNLFQLGLEPPKHLREMEDLARHYANKSGQDIKVRWREGTPDEPYKIKKEKEHGRGEVMRDRYGDYKMEEFEAGDKLRDDRGDIKKKTIDKELIGPPDRDYFERSDLRNGPSLWGEKEVPKRATGGEMKIDEDGNPVYRKSRGGEPVRDERGRQKYEERENPDYIEGEDEFILSVPEKESSMSYMPGERSIVTTDSKKGSGAGQILYQLANSYALRHGLEIDTTSGLSDVNALRMLGNTASTIARHGDNPRSVTGTRSGERRPATGRADPYDIMNAELGETEARLKYRQVDPRRVEFDGDDFLIDGVPASAKDIERKLGEISPRADWSGVGTKTLMRAALMRFLETVSPEEAAKLAKTWSKRLGPVFAGGAAAAVGVGAGTQNEMSQD